MQSNFTTIGCIFTEWKHIFTTKYVFFIVIILKLEMVKKMLVIKWNLKGIFLN